jgi:glucose/arabinose dehydrogenase
MKQALLPLVLGALLLGASQSTAQLIKLELINGSFTNPVDLVFDHENKLYVVQRRAIVRVLEPDGTLSPDVFFDIDDRVQSGSERGLLGLVFHPEYPDSNYLYVNYTNNSGNTVISRFTVDVEGREADPDSEKVLLTQDQPFGNHNAGDLNFGPDGMLYFGLGDGGSAGDPVNAGQRGDTYLGKMIRIDVDQGDPYTILDDNPFLDDPEILDEIWALGLRNPWRFSFDRATGDMWIADVGQNELEEVNRQLANSNGGENYGWRCYEASSEYNTDGCGPISAYTFPVWEYEHGSTGGCSVTGGFVYRGSKIPELVGKYIYADYCSGRIWALSEDGGVWSNEELLDTDNEISTFGENQDGELFLADLDGRIYSIEPTQATRVEGELHFKELSLAPNPAHDRVLLQMQVEQHGNYQFRLLNLDGRILRSWDEQVTGTYSKSLSLKDLPKGVYILRIQRDKREHSLRIVKM